MPRKYVQRISPEERVEIGRKNAAVKYGGEFPPREKRKQISVPEYIYDQLDAMRGRRTWPSFFAALAGLPTRKDRRRTPAKHP